MAEANVFEQGFDRFQATVKDIDREVQRVRKQVDQRRRGFEKDLRSRRLRFEKQAEKQVRRLRSELRKNPIYKRAEEIQSDARKQIEGQLDQVMSAIPIASRNEVETLERKVARLTKRVRELEKTNGEDETV